MTAERTNNMFTGYKRFHSRLYLYGERQSVLPRFSFLTSDSPMSLDVHEEFVLFRRCVRFIYRFYQLQA